MTVVISSEYHAKTSLEEHGVACIDRKLALKQDIRELRIGILNIMPQAQDYEFNLLFPLGRSILQIEPVWIRLESHEYKSSNKHHLADLYVPFLEAIKSARLDGLIITGAPVEEIAFEKVHYWEEVKRILKYAYKNIPSTLGICWGGLALAKYLGIDKVLYPKKIFGVYKLERLKENNPIVGDMDDFFWCPQSRFAGIEDNTLEAEKEKGNIELLAYNKDTGYSIFESQDHRFVMHLGHPEYNSGRIVKEAIRDAKKGRKDVAPPKNFDIKNPVNSWRSNRNEFFTAWIKHVYLTTEF